MNTSEIKEREQQEAKDTIDAVIPPEDIVAFNESRSCADLYRLYQKKQLDIRPKFQRGIVWNNKDQALFVDSLIKQLPIPSLCISLDIKSQKRLVIDGLQRMWSIIHFLNFKEEDWCLPKTQDIDPKISNKKVSYIAQNEPILFDKLENLTIPITVLRCDYNKPSHMAYLFQIFRRLNSGGSKLLNQEIRNCIYSGPFNDFLREIVKSSEWMNFAQTSKNKVDNARFGNEERVLRFFAMSDNWNDYSGNLAQFLNRYMEKTKDSSAETIKRYRNLLLKSLNISANIHIPPEIQKNKNLMEGILVGIALNINLLENQTQDAIQTKFEKLLATNPYSSDVREGMAHTAKVKERLGESIRIFGA